MPGTEERMKGTDMGDIRCSLSTRCIRFCCAEMINSRKILKTALISEKFSAIFCISKADKQRGLCMTTCIGLFLFVLLITARKKNTGSEQT